MDFLLSNYAPLRTSSQTFADTFYNLLPKTEQLDIAVGYITPDSLSELQKAVEAAQNLYTNGVSVDIIAKSLGMTFEQVEDIVKENVLA